jgi:phage terminase small subunit
MTAQTKRKDKKIMKTRGLTDKQILFINKYFLLKCNATAAYLATYPRVKRRDTAKAAAARLLTNVNVKAEIARRQKKAREENEDIVALIRKELEASAFANIGNYLTFGPKGVVLKESADMTDEMLAGVAEVTETITEHGGTVRCKIQDKLRALELLMKYYGLIVDRKQDLDADVDRIPEGMVPMKQLIEEIWGSNKPGRLWNEGPKLETGDL